MAAEVFTSVEVRDNIAAAKKATLADPSSYGRHGTRLLDSVVEFLGALTVAESLLSIRRFAAKEYTRQGLACLAERAAKGEWYEQRLFRALVGDCDERA